MERSEQEALVGKTFTAQGLLEGREADLAKRNADISANMKELERLEALRKSNDKKIAERDALSKEIDVLKKEIDGYLATLEKERIVLPFGSKTTKQVSL